MFTFLALIKTKTPGDIWAGLIIDAALLIFLMVFLGLGAGIALFGAATALTAIIR